MAKRRVAEFLLKLINLLLTISGLAILIYGIVLLIRWKRASSYSSSLGAGSNSGLLNKEQILVARRLFAAVHFSKSFSDGLPAAWFIHLLIAIGATLFVISCFGYIGAAARNRCCLSFSAFIVILVTVEVGFAAFIFFESDWKEEIPADRTGNFLAIDNVLNTHWKVIKWIALGGVILEAIVFVLALYLVIVGWTATANYDSDGSIIRPFQHPVTAWRTVPVTGQRTVPVTGIPVANKRI